MLKGLTVAEVLEPAGRLLPYEDGNPRWDWRLRESFQMNKEDTYMLIFAPGNYNALECFKEQFKGKIVFESKKATNYNHSTGPRNTLVIFESSDDETT